MSDDVLNGISSGASGDFSGTPENESEAPLSKGRAVYEGVTEGAKKGWEERKARKSGATDHEKNIERSDDGAKKLGEPEQEEDESDDENQDEQNENEGQKEGQDEQQNQSEDQQGQDGGDDGDPGMGPRRGGVRALRHAAEPAHRAGADGRDHRAQDRPVPAGERDHLQDGIDPRGDRADDAVRQMGERASRPRRGRRGGSRRNGNGN